MTPSDGLQWRVSSIKGYKRRTFTAPVGKVINCIRSSDEDRMWKEFCITIHNNCLNDQMQTSRKTFCTCKYSDLKVYFFTLWPFLLLPLGFHSMQSDLLSPQSMLMMIRGGHISNSLCRLIGILINTSSCLMYKISRGEPTGEEKKVKTEDWKGDQSQET